MSTPPLDDTQKEMTEALRIVMRRNLSMKGSPLADNYTRCFGEPAGKLVRGMLTLNVVQMVSGDFRSGLSAACAVEMLHLSGMIVDDWMDSAKVRHGKPTVASQYGTSPAFAIARHLLYKSFAELATYGSQELLRCTQSVVEAMIAGQRIEAQTVRFGQWDHYCRCIAGKTAALFALACEAATLVVGTSTKLKHNARSFGHSIGMAFQIVDDHLDYFGSDSFGKHIGMDFFGGIRSAPLLLLSRKSGRHARKIRGLMSAPSRTPEQFEDLLAEMLREGISEETLAVARSYAERAKRQLVVFPAVPERAWLHDLADDLITRTH